MKKINFLILFAFLVIFCRGFANPVVDYWINEFSVDSLGWKIELHCNQPWQDSVSMDGWFMTTKTDTAFFKDGLHFNPINYFVITNDDLKSKLKINLDGDEISLYQRDTESFHQIDDISFGDDISIYPISTPHRGLSICRNQDFLYFDKSPTFGFENDTSDIRGSVDGYIRDMYGNPLKGVSVIYSYFYSYFYPYQLDSAFVLTDSIGYYKFQGYAQRLTVYFKKINYRDSSKIIQIYPDSTVTFEDVKLITGIVEKIPSYVINDFYLSQNFPNPFNNSTSFYYTLPKGDNVVVSIYDEKGALVQKIFSGYQPAGEYKINWKTDNLASGVYIYQVNAGSFKISRKAILLK